MADVTDALETARKMATNLTDAVHQVLDKFEAVPLTRSIVIGPGDVGRPGPTRDCRVQPHPDGTVWLEDLHHDLAVVGELLMLLDRGLEEREQCQGQVTASVIERIQKITGQTV